MKEDVGEGFSFLRRKPLEDLQYLSKQAKSGLFCQGKWLRQLKTLLRYLCKQETEAKNVVIS